MRTPTIAIANKHSIRTIFFLGATYYNTSGNHLKPLSEVNVSTNFCSTILTEFNPSNGFQLYFHTLFNFILFQTRAHWIVFGTSKVFLRARTQFSIIAIFFTAMKPLKSSFWPFQECNYPITWKPLFKTWEKRIEKRLISWTTDSRCPLVDY